MRNPGLRRSVLLSRTLLSGAMLSVALWPAWGQGGQHSMGMGGMGGMRMGAGGHAPSGPGPARMSGMPGISRVPAPAGNSVRFYGTPPVAGGQRYGYANPQSSYSPQGQIRPSFELPGTSHPTFELPNNPLQTSPAKGIRHQYGFHNRANVIPFGYAAGFYPGYAGYPGYFDNGLGYGDDSAYSQAQGAPPQGMNSGEAGPGPAGGQQLPYQGSPYDGGEAQRAPYEPGDQTGAYGPGQGGPAGARSTRPENAQSSGPVTNGLEHPEITLIFNNGRPPETITSYALTRTTLFALNGTHQRQIPLSELNIPATVEKNQENGVDFSVPGTPN
jgi:hypothetical protein